MKVYNYCITYGMIEYINLLILHFQGESLTFCELMKVMIILACAGNGSGHVRLFRVASKEWLDVCKVYLADKHVAEKLQDDQKKQSKLTLMVDNACSVLTYLADIISAIKLAEDSKLTSAALNLQGKK